MLNKQSDQIRECLQHAKDCARKAAAQTDPNLKNDFFEMERRWLFLARSYEFTEQLETTFPTRRSEQADKLAKT
jgi:hypothetical protein